jgi:hypothetical protein
MRVVVVHDLVGPSDALLLKVSLVSTWTASSFVCLCHRRMMTST